MKVSDAILPQGQPPEILDLLDQIIAILNNGRYQLRVIEEEPDFENSQGEMLIQVSEDGVTKKLWFFDGTVWNSIAFNSDGGALSPISGSVVNTKYTQDSTIVSTSNIILDDDSKPQSSEGAEYTQLATSITPSSSSNSLIIRVNLNTRHSAGDTSIFAIFKDSDTDALVAKYVLSGAAFDVSNCYLTFEMKANTILPITFKLRYGTLSGTIFLNSNSAGSAKFDGIYFSSMEIMEIKA